MNLRTILKFYFTEMHNIVYKLSEDYEDTRMKISGIKLRLSQKGGQQQNQVV